MSNSSIRHTKMIPTWISSYSETCCILVLSKVSECDLRGLENKYKIKFPTDYIEFVTKTGLYSVQCQFDGRGPSRIESMLHPTQIEEILDCFAVWTIEHNSSGENEKEQQKIRNDLIPFQYCGNETSLDVYCFVQNREHNGELQVIVAYHDDDELQLWFNQKHEDKIWGFSSHLENWQKKMKER